jgi:hypothetical protein
MQMTQSGAQKEAQRTKFDDVGALDEKRTVWQAAGRLETEDRGKVPRKLDGILRDPGQEKERKTKDQKEEPIEAAS